MTRLCLLFLVLLAGCVWSAKTPASAQNSSATASPDASTQPLTPCPPVVEANGNVWLDELNRWREMAGLRAVRENPRMSQGSYAHARYLVKAGPPDDASFIAYKRTIGAAMHTEDSSSPFYSAEGAYAAKRADVSWAPNQCRDVQGLVVAPFHRFSLLDPWITIAGYGAFGDYPRRAAALVLGDRDLIGKSYSELREILSDSGGMGQVEFPPDGSTSAIAAMINSEWPNPLTSCPGYVLPVGLPISLQMGMAVRLESFSLRDVTKDHPVEACALDGFTYTNPDAVVQAHGRRVLIFYGAAVLIPRYPLSPGHRYAVGIKTLGHAVNWTFGISANARIRAPLITGEPLRY